MTNNFHSGYVTQNDFKNVSTSGIFTQLEKENDRFRTSFLPELASYGHKWTTDSFHQWSRVWEYPYIFNALKTHIPKERDSKVLDAGCGLSFFPFFVAKEFPRTQVFGIDLDKNLEMTYSALNKKSGSNVDFKVGYLQSLPYESSSFDVVYCISVLEHTSNYREIVEEFHRVLKPGGKLILTLDISLNGDRQIPVDEGQGLLDFLLEDFVPSERAESIKEGSSKKDLLTTSFARKMNKNLLPWRSPWKNALKLILSGKMPKLIFELACYCQIFEKRT